MSGRRTSAPPPPAGVTARRAQRLQDALFVVLVLLLVGLGGWLSDRHAVRYDWTASGAHTLAEASIEVLDGLDGPIEITAFARQGSPQSERIEALLDRYRRAYPHLAVERVNPDLAPARVRELGITAEGQLTVTYRDRREIVREPTEQAVTNALVALTRGKERRVLFLAGHGERQPHGKANHDLGRFSDQLARSGVQLGAINPAASGALPEEMALLVIAGRQVGLLPGEQEQLEAYVADGGNLLWLLEPELEPLAPLLERVGVHPLPGVAVVATGQAYGIGDPSFAVVADYPDHPVTREFDDVTLLPQARALVTVAGSGWEATPLLRTSPRSWVESGPVDDTVRHDTGEQRGPLTLAVALERPRPDGGTQRVVVVGDGDFLANAYLGNGGNLDLGLRVVNWLVEDDVLISIPPRSVPDRNLALSQVQFAVIGFGFLVGSPLLLLGIGLGSWWRRRRR
jgi:ABC-type uncharacterized transport system involved in gliding motility auxiliary subunit